MLYLITILALLMFYISALLFTLTSSPEKYWPCRWLALGLLNLYPDRHGLWVNVKFIKSFYPEKPKLSSNWGCTITITVVTLFLGIFNPLNGLIFALGSTLFINFFYLCRVRRLPASL